MTFPGIEVPVVDQVIRDILALKLLALIGVDFELSMTVDVSEVGLYRIRTLAAAGNLDHDFRDTRYGAPDLIQLRRTELQRRVATAPAMTHDIQFGQSPAAVQTSALGHRPPPN